MTDLKTYLQGKGFSGPVFDQGLAAGLEGADVSVQPQGLDVLEVFNWSLGYFAGLGFRHGSQRDAQQPGPAGTLAASLLSERVHGVPDIPTAGTLLVARERRRQIETEGYDSRHDSAHGPAALMLAGVSYLLSAARAVGGASTPVRSWQPQLYWPWDLADYKPRTAQRDVERAAALAIAALDCLLAPAPEGGAA
ncbi:MAG TPA: hypothetical protein VF017_15345 [Thermoanaerobaculia bacterium]|nr:hypothetical protein [Thermoanaerobaculia bacterium]